MRVLHILAFGFIFFGGVLLLTSTFGFSSLAADRGVSISTGDEETALLGYNYEEDVGELRRGNEVEVATLFNNLNEDMEIFAADIKLEITTDDGETVDSNVLDVEFDDESQNPVTFSDDVELLLSCNDDRDIGDSTVIIEIVDAQSVSNEVTISGVSFATAADIQCDGGGPPVGGGEIRANDVRGDTQTFEVGTSDRGNLQQATIDFSSVDFIDYSNAEVEATGGIDPELDEESQEITFDEDPEDNAAEVTLTNITVDESGSAVVGFTEDRTGPHGSTDEDRFTAYP